MGRPISTGILLEEPVTDWMATGATATEEPSSLDLAVELAHDLRSPLGAIMTLTDLLQSGACGPITPSQRTQLQVILQAARGLERITEDVVQGGRDGVDVEAEFEVADVLRTVRATVQPMVESAGLRLLVRNEVPGRWIGNRGAITRVLLNLATNALKFTSFGLVEFGAKVRTSGDIEFFVRDTGSGMVTMPANPLGGECGAQKADRWRLNGSGLGLHISRRLVEAMGSKLEVESRPGRGSRFAFALASGRAKS